MAFSGGGDSLALLIAASAWARRRGRPLLALTVDHGLRPESRVWSAWCADRCARLGLAHRVLAWEGEKPAAGLSAAARAARQALLADAARAAGASVILMGHTADDIAETHLMRQAGSTAPAPRLWSPSPAWPEGRGVFIFRPLLGVGRAELRAVLLAEGETWIEDPANSDLASLRARVRRELAGESRPSPPACAAAPAPGIDLAEVSMGPAADLALSSRALLLSAAPERVLGTALVCASGAVRPPRRAALGRLLERIEEGRPFAATLAGARLLAGGGQVRLVRDAADVRRPPGGQSLRLPANGVVVWDGRVAMRARVQGATAGPARGQVADLPPGLKRALRCAPAPVRPAVPLVRHADKTLDGPTLAPSARVAASALSLRRLAAALGAITDEASAMAHGGNPDLTLNERSNPDEACL